MERMIDPRLEAALAKALAELRVLEDALHSEYPNEWTLSMGETAFPVTVQPVENGVKFVGQVVSGTVKHAGHPIMLAFRGEDRAMLPLADELEARLPLEVSWKFTLPEGTFVG